MKILNRFTCTVIFECKCETQDECVEKAVEEKVSLRCANLRNADLMNSDLRNADLRNADLNNADLRNANLRNANLWNADLRNANLWHADLRNADLRNANLSEADLRRADLSEADLSDVNLRNANLSDVNLSNANLWGDKISSCPICLTYGLYYPVWITDRKIKIGCQIHSTKAWENFTDEQIKKMDGDKALNFWKVWKEPILKLAEAHQNKGGEK